MFPAPHEDLLKAHYQTSMFPSVAAAAQPLGHDDYDDDDDPELPEIAPIRNEAVTIWADDPTVGRPIDVEERDTSSAGTPKCKDVG
jgi:hypothetical protein